MLILLCVAVFAQQKGSFTDPRDKKTYKTVKIGEQVWMAENLNYNAKGSKCYDNKPANCDKYGRLYDWETAMKACPSGWHLPTKEEWDALYKVVDGETALKSKSGWSCGECCDIEGEDCEWLGNGTDDYGFSALPGGGEGAVYSYDSGNSFCGVGSLGNWWSASEYYSGYGYSKGMNYFNPETCWDHGFGYLYSVRCLKD